MIKIFFKKFLALGLLVTLLFVLNFLPILSVQEANAQAVRGNLFGNRETEEDEDSDLTPEDQAKKELIDAHIESTLETPVIPTQERKTVLDEADAEVDEVAPAGKPGKFLWKPVSDSDGNLVILYDSLFDAQVFIPSSTNGQLLLYTGCRQVQEAGTNNGYLNGLRCDMPGASFPPGTVVKIGQDEIVIDDPASRIEGDFLLFAAPSINDFLLEEGDEGYGTADLLMSLGGAAVSCAFGQISGNLLAVAMGEIATGLRDFNFLTTTTAGGGIVVAEASTSITTGTVSVEDVNLGPKESGSPWFPSTDGVAFCLLNSMIVGLSDATVAWINSGFEGNPIFIDNPEKFFKDLADREISIFLSELGDGFLCKEFDLDLKLAIINQETERRGGWCTLDRAKENVERTLSGDWFSFEVYDEIRKNPANTPVGAYLILDGEIRTSVQEQIANTSKELDWGGGYFSWKVCEEVEVDEGFAGPANQICETVTPGDVIQSKVNDRLGLAEGRILVADEFNEIVNALVNQLIKIAAEEILGA